MYADVTYFQGETYEECQHNVMDTVNMFVSVGFTIHVLKSVLQAKQKITTLGLVIDSVKVYPLRFEAVAAPH